MAKKKDKKKEQERKTFHEDLRGFDITVDTFGELQSSLDIDKINEFLNENVEDKKLKSPSEEEE